MAKKRTVIPALAGMTNNLIDQRFQLDQELSGRGQSGVENQIYCPLSTLSTSPVIILDFSESRKSTALAISSSVASFFN